MDSIELVATRGPQMSFIPPSIVGNYDTTFRMLAAYNVTTDSVYTRFDVLINGETSDRGFTCTGEQFNYAFDGAPNGKQLKVPNGGILQGMVVHAEGRELAKALRAMADAIDATYKPRSR